MPQEDEYDDEEAEQQRMMGFTTEKEEHVPLASHEQQPQHHHVPTALTRVTPNVQRAQSELTPSALARAELEAGIQRSHSQSEIHW